MTEDAERIANIIMDTNTDDRGDLLLQVSDILRANSQGYTAALFKSIGDIYNGD